MRTKVKLIFVIAALVPIWLSGVVVLAQESHEKKHGFSVKQYEVFHDLLHPLQHDALPNKDWRQIRTKSALLANRGYAIVRVGVPRGVSDENKTEFRNELRKFNLALGRFRSDARRGGDAQLETSFSAVHDSFEMLAAMLPR